jgi:hypothetical protein
MPQQSIEGIDYDRSWIGKDGRTDRFFTGFVSSVLARHRDHSISISIVTLLSFRASLLSFRKVTARRCTYAPSQEG